MFIFPDRKSVIAVGGPPHSGKSVFLAELYRQLLANPEVGSRVFLQRTCPDGEGMWSAESDQDLVKQLRQKGDFSSETMNFYVNSLDGLRRNKDMVLADLGGFISMENVIITAHATDLVVLSSKEEKLRQWISFAQRLDEIILAIQQADLKRLVTFQQEGLLDIIPPTKLDQFRAEGQLEAEVRRRIELLQTNLGPLVEGMQAHKLNIIAELGSRLLTEEQRTEADEFLSRGEALSTDLTSHIETNVFPLRGEIVDLDRNRGSETYQSTIQEIGESINGLNQERLAEYRAEREGHIRLA